MASGSRFAEAGFKPPKAAFPKLQVFTSKTKYLAPLHFADYDKRISILVGLKKLRSPFGLSLGSKTAARAKRAVKIAY